MRDEARVVIIGGGIFGASVAYHLATAGCGDIVLVDKGELTSGTTFHSVGLVSQFRTSPALMKVMNYTIRLFNKLHEEVGDTLGWRTVGSLRLASSPDRLKSLQREVSRARAIGITAELISAEEAVARAPFLSPAGLYGAVYVPDDGHIDPSAITYELARQAKRLGAEVATRVRVTGIDLDAKGQVTRVRTDQGDIRTGCVVNAAGEWAPRIGEMVGVHIPMVPLMHQYLTTQPIPGHELPPETPVVRDPDRLFYCREDVGAFLIGAFEGNPKAWSVEGVPWSFTQELLNPEWDLFEPVLEAAMERIPLLARAEAVELVNGPDAFTPDGHYALGPVPGLRGFYVAAGGSINGIAGAGGVGKLIAEWILEGAPSIDTHEMDVRRFGAHLADTAYLSEHCREVYRYYYRLRYPGDENEWGRPLRTSPFFPRLQRLGAVFGEKNGWERVNYFDPGRTWRRAGADQRQCGWGRAPHFDRVGDEARTVRRAAGILDMTSFGKIEVRGPGALELLQRLAAGNLDKAVGAVTYTQFLNARGGIESDITVTRLADDVFRVVSGTAFVANDLGWIRLHLPDDGSVSVTDVTEEWACLSLCGPLSRAVLEKATGDDVSNPAFPYLTARPIEIAGVRLWAQRISYTGELGWELYMPPQDALAVWDALMAAGRPIGLLPFGYKALDSLRIEKGYLYWSGDITPEDTPLEAGLGFAVAWDKKDFIGRAALLKLRAEGPRTALRALLMDAGGNLYGGESIYDGKTLVNRVRTGNFGFTVGRDIGLAYLPPSLAAPGTQLTVEVLGEAVAAEVAALPLVDPGGERLRV
jgi:4-methylaminobutanoate oxidase (formaldehyde-forming)